MNSGFSPSYLAYQLYLIFNTTPSNIGLNGNPVKTKKVLDHFFSYLVAIQEIQDFKIFIVNDVIQITIQDYPGFSFGTEFIEFFHIFFTKEMKLMEEIMES